MATATFSLSVTGVSANSRFQVKNDQIDDNFANSVLMEQQTMSDGASFLVKGPDGMLRRSVLDAERTVPGVLRVLRRV